MAAVRRRAASCRPSSPSGAGRSGRDHILRLFDGGHAVDDISATPREKTREEIIAEAEAAAFADS